MWLDDQEYFNAQINKLVGKIPDELRPSFNQSIETFLELKIKTFGMLLNNLQNPQLDETSRVHLCWFAGQSGNKRLSKALLNLFNEDSILLTWEAAKALRQLRSKRAISPLIKLLKQSETLETRKAAVYALAALPLTIAIQALIETLMDKNENAEVRGLAAESLAFIGNGQSQVISSLLSGLNDDEAEVRFWSLYSLGELGSLEIIPAIERLTGDKTVLPGWWSISEEAHSAIEQIMLKT